MDSESCGSESDAPSEGLLSEDEFPIGQPELDGRTEGSQLLQTAESISRKLVVIGIKRRLRGGISNCFGSAGDGSPRFCW
jgi:hypothetical protein